MRVIVAAAPRFHAGAEVFGCVKTAVKNFYRDCSWTRIATVVAPFGAAAACIAAHLPCLFSRSAIDGVEKTRDHPSSASAWIAASRAMWAGEAHE